jgi:hypothetical protein
MTDVVTENFFKRRANGEIINNPLHKTVIEIAAQPLIAHAYVSTQLYGCSPAKWYSYKTIKVSATKEFEPTLATTPDLNVESIKDQAVSACWASISPAQLEGLVSALEMDKTVVGFLDLFKKAFRILRAVKKKELKLLKKEFSRKEMIELYMNARYNLRPVYHDVRGLLKALDFEVCADFDRQTFRGYKKEYAINSIETTDRFTDTSDWAYKIFSHSITNRTVEARAGVLTSFEPSTISMFELLGLDQGLTSAWELIPFSFIVDWFVNVGNTICQFKPDRTFKALTSWVVVKDTTTQITVPQYGIFENYVPPGSAKRLTGIDCAMSGGYRKVITTVTTREPSPQRSLMPRLKIRLDPLKILDLAIITQKIFSKRPTWRYR